MLGELSVQQIEDVLQAEAIGRIGCHVGGRTYIVPITYAYDGECIYGHSAAGMKVQMMRNNSSVCFEVEHIDDLDDWRCVVAWGTFEELRGNAATAGMRQLLDRFLPMVGSTAHPGHTSSAAAEPAGTQARTAGIETILYRIHLTEKTGRFEKR